MDAAGSPMAVSNHVIVMLSMTKERKTVLRLAIEDAAVPAHDQPLAHFERRFHAPHH